MPEIFRAYGYSFLFFSREHEPIHIHVVGHDGEARYVWNGKEFLFSGQHGIKSGDLKKIKAIIDENSGIIIYRWNEIFNK